MLIITVNLYLLIFQETGTLMSAKAFISYCHKDEKYKDDFVEHLATLKKSKKISTWDDRDIAAGSDWRNSIDANLQSADIMFLLLSSSFFASDYCTEVEMKFALEQLKNKKLKIIAIVVRPVEWADSPISHIQALPKDAKAITESNNQDSAWTQVVQGIRKTLDESPTANTAVIPSKFVTPTLQAVFNTWLMDTEVELKHRHVDKIDLSNIYVSPDLQLTNEKKKLDFPIQSSDILLTCNEHWLISGEEQQGKTTLLKHIAVESLKKSILPIYLDASKIKRSDVNEVLKKALRAQYENVTIERVSEYESVTILIDNIDHIGLNTKYTNTFLDALTKQFPSVIITCHDSFGFVSNGLDSLTNFSTAAIKNLGNVAREELIRKWVSLGVEENISDETLYAEIDEIKNRLNTVIRKNLAPSKPLYVLMFMQLFEANQALDLEMSSYGHCYQQLIYTSLENAKIKNSETNKYINVLTELAWAIFKNKAALNAHQIEDFFENYSKRYLKVDRKTVLKNLTDHSILSEDNSFIHFKYSYIYYYFIGKMIAENYGRKDEVKQEATALFSQLHRESVANILIFVTHHTKDDWVLQEINTTLSCLFDEQPPATLDNEELSFMSHFVNQIPALVMEQREIQSEREKTNRKLDEIESKNKHQNSDLHNEEDNTESSDILAKINTTFKGMEISGQIIRNRHDNLEKSDLFDLADHGTSAGLRFLKYFLGISDTAKSEVIKLIAAQLADHPNLTNQEVQQQAESTYLFFSYNVISALIRKIASSIGSKEASEIYLKLAKTNNTPAIELVRLAIELQFERKTNFSVNSVEQTLTKLGNNPTCIRLLKEMVINHIYMYPVPYQEKQKLSKLLNISMQRQRLMDQRKRAKA